MTENDGRLEEWMYDFAWKLLENAQVGNERLDNKAMSIINFSSIIVPIITGVLFFSVEQKITIGNCISILLIIALGFLILSIISAFLTIWLIDQGTIRAKNHFLKCSADAVEVMGSTAQTIADWQETVEKAGKKKETRLLASSYCFILALLLISFSGALYLFK